MIEDFLRHKIDKIQSLVAHRSNSNNPLKCTGCNECNELLICVHCDKILCLNHLKSSETHSKSHTLFFTVKNKKLFCSECGSYFSIDDYIKDHRPKDNQKSSDIISVHSIKGIQNFGKTDFINSVLQVILNTEEVFNYFFSFHHSKKDCPVENCPDCFFKNIYSMIYSKNPVDMSTVLFTLSKIAPELLHPQINNVLTAYNTLVNMYHKNLNDRCECIMHEVFFGKLKTEKKCSHCGNTTYDDSEFSSLSLSCDYDLSDALSRYFQSTSSESTFFCNSCNNKADLLIEKEIVDFPKVLTLFFKRFDDESLTKKKKFKVDIRLELDIGKTEYGLYAFTEHCGSYPGKYISYILINRMWYEFNNEKVIENVNIEYKFSNALLLFYKRK